MAGGGAVTAWIALLLGVPALPLVFLGILTGLNGPAGPAREVRANGLLAVGLGMATAANLLDGSYVLAVITGTGAVIAAWLWWKNRRRRKDRAARSMGAKSRALVAALVRKAREAARPRPVLRPVPGAVS